MIPVAGALALITSEKGRALAGNAIKVIGGIFKGKKKKKLEKALKEENQRVYMVQKNQIPPDKMPETAREKEFSFWDFLKNLF